MIGAEDADPVRWSGSEWRCLKVPTYYSHGSVQIHGILQELCFVQVRWDETSPVHPERVSPWNIEVALSPTLDAQTVCRPKRPRGNMVPSSTDPFFPTREGIVQLTDACFTLFTLSLESLLYSACSLFGHCCGAQPFI